MNTIKYVDMLQAEKYKKSTTPKGKTFWYKISKDRFKRPEYKNVDVWSGDENQVVKDSGFSHQLYPTMCGYKYKEQDLIDVICNLLEETA